MGWEGMGWEGMGQPSQGAEEGPVLFSWRVIRSVLVVVLFYGSVG